MRQAGPEPRSASKSRQEGAGGQLQTRAEPAAQGGSALGSTAQEAEALNAAVVGPDSEGGSIFSRRLILSTLRTAPVRIVEPEPHTQLADCWLILSGKLAAFN